jgi:hypothetical protein
MALVWLEAERDVDPTGSIRAAVRAGVVRRESLDDYVAGELVTNQQLCCSGSQLREYLLALLDTPPPTYSL